VLWNVGKEILENTKMGLKERNSCIVLENDHLEDLDEDWRIIYRYM
jgi:hypothetical protein